MVKAHPAGSTARVWDLTNEEGIRDWGTHPGNVTDATGEVCSYWGCSKSLGGGGDEGGIGMGLKVRVCLCASAEHAVIRGEHFRASVRGVDTVEQLLGSKTRSYYTKSEIGLTARKAIRGKCASRGFRPEDAKAERWMESCGGVEKSAKVEKTPLWETGGGSGRELIAEAPGEKEIVQLRGRS